MMILISKDVLPFNASYMKRKETSAFPTSSIRYWKALLSENKKYATQKK